MSKLWLQLKRFFLLVVYFGSPKVKAPARKRDPSQGKEIEAAGRWYFKRDILDQLDEYMKIIRRMKKTDPEGYALYSKIGAAITTPKIEVYEQLSNLSPIWSDKTQRPTFGAVAWLRMARVQNMVHAKVAYFRRLDRVPATVEQAIGQVYEVTLFHAEVDGKKPLRLSSNYFIEINDAGQIRPLHYLHLTEQKIQHHDRGSHRGGCKISTVYRKTWTFGYFLNDEGDDLLKIDDPNPAWKTPAGRAAIVFSCIAASFQMSSSGLRVSCTKNNATAMFGIDMLRTPYFFDEREVVYGDTGKRKKIFHIVRTHERIAKGRKTYVRSHFRGVREFDWKGYHVIISMPGKHHNDLLDMRAGMHYFDADEEMPRGFIETPEFASTVSDHLKKPGRGFAYRRRNHELFDEDA